MPRSAGRWNSELQTGSGGAGQQASGRQRATGAGRAASYEGGPGKLQESSSELLVHRLCAELLVLE